MTIDRLTSETKHLPVNGHISSGAAVAKTQPDTLNAASESFSATQSDDDRSNPVIGSQIELLSEFDPQPYLELRVWADTFAQVQANRMALANRLRAGAVPKDVVAELLENYNTTEKMVAKAMKKSFRRACPAINAWVKSEKGVGLGEHLMARLVGTIGHPYVAIPHHYEGDGPGRVLVQDPPFFRNLYKLYAYCGVGDPTRKRRRGMDKYEAAALGNASAKMIVHLISEMCIRQVGKGLLNPANQEPAALADLSHDVDRDQSNRDTQETGVSVDLSAIDHPPSESHTPPVDSTLSDDSEKIRPSASARRSPYRDVYDAGRKKYAEREDWTLGHQHNAALRLVGKAVLKDLWIVSRDDFLATYEVQPG